MSGRIDNDRVRWPITGCLVLSAVALAVAPLTMPDFYSWMANTTSESAAQGLPWGWVARTGFVLFGVAVLWLVVEMRTRWGPWGVALHGAFGVLMLAAASFSNRPIETRVPVDAFEDSLHSLAATLMGFAFVGGVIVVTTRRKPRVIRVLDLVAVGASVAIPLGMVIWPGAAGLFQRAMFLIAYAWYLLETWDSDPTSSEVHGPTESFGDCQ